MSLLNKIKGFIKLSEVSVDSDQPLLDTQSREDANNVLTQSSFVIEDALRKQSLVATSNGSVTWALNKLLLDANVDIVVKILQNQSSQVVNLVMNYADFAAGIDFANDGDTFYIELNRNNISGSVVNIYNGGPNTGQRAIVSSSLPPLVNNQSGSFQGTICIPIAVRQGNNLWWNPSGFYWSPGTSGIIGTIGSTDPIPTGTVLSFSGEDADTPSGYLFCDGSSKSAALYPALATLYWTGINYIYGGSGYSPGPTPNGNFNLPDLQGLFIKGAGSHGTLINGKQYSATLAQKDSDRTAVNSLSTVTNGSHRHAHFSDGAANGGLGYLGHVIEGGGGASFWSNVVPRDTGLDPNHTHPMASSDQQTHPAHMGLNYIVKA